MPNQTPENPLPFLKRVLEISKGDLLVLLLSARNQIQAHLVKIARDPKFAVSGNQRELAFRNIGKIYDVLQSGLGKWIIDLVFGSTLGSLLQSDGEFSKPLGDSITKFSRRYAKDILQLVAPINAESLIAVQTQRMKQQDIAFLRQTFIDLFRKSSLTGMTRAELQRELARKMLDISEGGLPSWQFIDKTGRKWSNGSYFNMLLRTVGSRVSRETYLTRLIEAGHDLVTIEGGADPCPVCKAWRGVICSITGSTKGYPTLNQAQTAGVFHPNCVCEPRYIDATIAQAGLNRKTPPLTATGDELTAYARKAGRKPGYNDDPEGSNRDIIDRERKILRSRVASLEKWIKAGRGQDGR